MIRKIGRGKYSEVFEGINVRTNKMCVIKVQPRTSTISSAQLSTQTRRGERKRADACVSKLGSCATRVASLCADSEARQEEKNQTRDQNSAESHGRTEYHSATRHGARSCQRDAVAHLRARRQRGFQGREQRRVTLASCVVASVSDVFPSLLLLLVRFCTRLCPMRTCVSICTSC